MRCGEEERAAGGGAPLVQPGLGDVEDQEDRRRPGYFEQACIV
jgi:hypothetical protein